jgi:uncharacterized protein
VRVSELPDSGRVFHFHKSEAWLSALPEVTQEITLERPIEVDLDLSPEGDGIKLSGRLQGAVRVSCSRCLQKFVFNLDEAIDFMLLEPLAGDAPEEIDLTAEELDTEFFDGETIDVDHIATEQIFLALPQRPLCRPECKGLCSGCGADLNVESCQCEKGESGSPFDVLRSIKIR